MVTDDWDPGDMMHGSTGSGGMGGAGIVMMLLVGLLLVVLVATTIYVALKASGMDRTPQAAPAPPVEPAVGSPRDLLDQRLARGEISPEEYRTIRTLLGS